MVKFLGRRVCGKGGRTRWVNEKMRCRGPLRKEEFGFTPGTKKGKVWPTENVCHRGLKGHTKIFVLKRVFKQKFLKWQEKIAAKVAD